MPLFTAFSLFHVRFKRTETPHSLRTCPIDSPSDSPPSDKQSHYNEFLAFYQLTFSHFQPTLPLDNFSR